MTAPSSVLYFRAEGLHTVAQQASQQAEQAAQDAKQAAEKEAAARAETERASAEARMIANFLTDEIFSSARWITGLEATF